MKTEGMTYIAEVLTENTGGGCMVDFVVLEDGQVIGINDECVCLYPNMDSFYADIQGEEKCIMI